ncbi:fungal hydrophobin-domain-containing protein [Scleroderma yunnanense]
MFIRASALLLPVVALSSVVAAAPEPISARGGSSCSNGTLQCCTSTFDATQSNLNLLTGLLGIVASVPLVGPLLALNCSPITGLGLGTGANCAQQTVCCQNDQFTGLINVGCTNVNLGL